MAIFWYKKQFKLQNRLILNEMNKLVLKSLISNKFFNINQKIYYGQIFNQYSKKSSFSFFRRYCVLTGNSKSVFKNFKMVRHWCKSYASNGRLIGVRKASF